MDTKDIKQNGQCGKCVTNLLSVLESMNSRPKVLLDAMGVTMNNSNGSNTSFWQVAKDGSGVRINIPHIKKPVYDSTNTGINSVGFGGTSLSRPLHGSSIDETNDSNNDREKGTKDSDSSSSSQSSTFEVFKTFRDHLPGSSSRTVATSPSPSTEIDTTVDDAKKYLSLKIDCMKCSTEGPEGNARAFVKGPDPLSITLCSNRLEGVKNIEEVLVHELIHVFDVHSRKWDLTDCHTLAKSEVRAAREAECADNNLSFTKRYCVQEKARLATGNMFPKTGRDCVGKVFEEAMKDYAPFPNEMGPTDEKKNDERQNMIRGRVFKSSYKY